MAILTDDEYGTLAPELSTSSNRPITPQDPEQLGRYRIVRILGQGGMGKVYEAYDTKLERIVALKVMLPDTITQSVGRERFLREARTMAAVRNDHVVTVFEVDEAGDTPYLAMEFLHGESLANWMSAEERPSLVDVLRIGREIATGLAAAQAKGLIHRDIKPANIWLERGGNRLDRGRESNTAFTLPASSSNLSSSAFRVKILDFGLARPISQDCAITHSGAILGTPYYMSPEQARGNIVDGRSDLFSLGVVLYQLCTGQLPFKGSSITAVLTALAIDTPQPIPEKNQLVPEVLAELVMKLLEKDPDRRPQSADQVVLAFREIEARLLEVSPKSPGDSAKNSTLGPNALSYTISDEPRKSSPTAAPSKRMKRVMLAGFAIVFLFAAGIGALSLGKQTPDDAPGASLLSKLPSGPSIRIGVLYSRTGPMAIGERPILDGVLLAVQEINEKGGVLGRQLEVVAEDGQSDTTVFATKATKLIESDKVSCLFGCWSSACRKAVTRVVEKHDHLLFYPTSYEGMEMSPNVVYGGAVPNQQILPSLRYMHGFGFKKKWFLVGIDAIYSRAAHAVIQDEAKNSDCTIVGDEYLRVDNSGIGDLAERIEKSAPELIVNTIKGDSNVTLFRALRRAGMTSQQIPILSFAVSEDEFASLTPAETEGHYAAATYFHSIDSDRNREFLKRVEQRLGADRIVSDQMQTAYALVHMWALAAKLAESTDCKSIRKIMGSLEYDAPQGRIKFDSKTNHLVQLYRVGCIKNGRFEDVFTSPIPIQPEPFPQSRGRKEWDDLIHRYFISWGNRWQNLGNHDAK